MTDEERYESQEDDEVEAHRRRATEEATQTDEKDGEDDDDVEAHRRR